MPVRLVQRSRGCLLLFSSVGSDAACHSIGAIDGQQYLGDQMQEGHVCGGGRGSIPACFACYLRHEASQ